MNELYWIFVLGKLSTAFIMLCVMSTALFAMLGIALALGYTSVTDDESKIKIKKHKRIMNIVAIIAVSTFFASCFTPTEKQLMVIYGIGGTIDYLKDSIGVEKHLSDKTIKCLDLFIDKYTKEDESVGSKR